MDRKRATNIAVDVSNGLKDLLLDPTVTTDIARASEALERVIQQLQRDVLSMGRDRDESWAVVVGIEKLWEQILLFREEGMRDLATMKNRTEETTK